MARASRLFGPIDDNTVEQVFRDLSYGWYAVAAIQFVAQVYFVFALGFATPDLVDGFLALFAGYFLIRRRSRALAVMLLLYALLTLGVTVAHKLGFGNGGTNIFLALAVVWLAVRGLSATWFYQKRRCARIRWPAVIAIALAAIVAVFVALFAVSAAVRNAVAAGTMLSQQMVDLANASAEFFPAALVVAFLTLWWPFTDADPACPWPPKKHG